MDIKSLSKIFIAIVVGSYASQALADDETTSPRHKMSEETQKNQPSVYIQTSPLSPLADEFVLGVSYALTNNFVGGVTGLYYTPLFATTLGLPEKKGLGLTATGAWYFSGKGLSDSSWYTSSGLTVAKKTSWKRTTQSIDDIKIGEKLEPPKVDEGEERGYAINLMAGRYIKFPTGLAMTLGAGARYTQISESKVTTIEHDHITYFDGRPPAQNEVIKSSSSKGTFSPKVEFTLGWTF